MGLSQFIVDNIEPLLNEWEDFARTILPSAKMLDADELRSGGRYLLETIVAEMATRQSDRAPGVTSPESCRLPKTSDRAGQLHGAHRLAQGFDLGQLVAEYCALRASVIRLWAEKRGTDRLPLDELSEFNHAIDEVLTDAIRRYSSDVLHSRDLVMAVLGHDLRSPLGAMANSAQYLLRVEEPNTHASKAASIILSSAARMGAMVSDLLDFTRTRLGDVLPIVPESMDFFDSCQRTVEELNAFHPDATLFVEANGDLTGVWDPARIAQLLSNIIGNAIQHGAPGAPVMIVATGEPDAVRLIVHNEGVPIAASNLQRVFEPLAKAPANRPDPSSLGLGLYIAREIARAHGGTIDVSSSKGEGTTFTVRLPRMGQALAQPLAWRTPLGVRLSTVISMKESFQFLTRFSRRH